MRRSKLHSGMMKLLFSACLIFIFSTISVFAAVPVINLDSPGSGITPVASGNCGERGGDNVKWMLSNTGTMYLYGVGATDEAAFYPWEAYRSDITEVIVCPGITVLTQGVFYQCRNLKKLTLPPSLERIDNSAFYDCTGLETVIFTTSDIPLLVYPFANVGGTVYYPNTWTEVPEPGDYGFHSTWIAYSPSEIPARYFDYPKPGQTEPAQPEPEQPKPAQTEPAQTEPAASRTTISKKPTLVKVTALGKGRIKVTWKKFDRTTSKTKKIWKTINKVQVQYSTNSKFKSNVKSKLIGKTNTKLTIKGLKKKKTYYVRIRYKGAAGVYSKWSKVKKVKVK